MDVNKKKVIKIILAIILIIIILLLFFLYRKGKNNYSKYGGSINSNAVSEVAKPVFEVEGASDIKIDGIEDTVYVFSVKNYDSKETSDVDLDYYIQIENNSKADLEFILTKNGKRINLNNNKTDLITLSNLNKQSHEYQLRIKYNNNPAIENDIDGNVQIKVEAVQSKLK